MTRPQRRDRRPRQSPMGRPTNRPARPRAFLSTRSQGSTSRRRSNARGRRVAGPGAGGDPRRCATLGMAWANRAHRRRPKERTRRSAGRGESRTHASASGRTVVGGIRARAGSAPPSSTHRSSAPSTGPRRRHSRRPDDHVARADQGPERRAILDAVRDGRISPEVAKDPAAMHGPQAANESITQMNQLMSQMLPAMHHMPMAIDPEHPRLTRSMRPGGPRPPAGAAASRRRGCGR